jgi:deoxyribodipyrimidine photo-lyase
MRSLVWFRRDLRVADNTALLEASQHSTEGVIGLYLLSPKQWEEHDDAGCKVKFWLDNLAALSAALESLRIPLRLERADSFADAPQTIIKFAKKHDCSTLFLNREYEVNEVRRDNDVANACEQAGVGVRRFHDRVIVPPREITTKEGKFYSVFTPYRRVWDKRALEFVQCVAKPKKQPELDIAPSKIPDEISGFDFSSFRSELWKPGEAEAQSRLATFTKKIADYNAARDVPSIQGTSLISPYLAAGVISPRQCLAAAVAANDGKIEGGEGATTWISELAWRDFYTHVMVACPRVSMHQPFKLKTNALKWRTDENDFTSWTRGQTGYPIVDAGMRQLNQTGWMHNRLRMVTAMFLTKNLLIDWRWGERYFMQNLIDGDLAANNGGWQWSASTGTDSVPYFRIFNPFSQSKRFDPDGTFIKKMCPELGDVPKSALHDPAKLATSIKERGLDYPAFVVEYKHGRERALKAFKSLG